MTSHSRKLGGADTFRTDIEGLRAIAVLLVVVYHAQLGPFDGGLIGVDVFFVLSGFLITSLLLREIDSSGRVSLLSFWGRRARRLLPASTAVVLVTLAAAQWMLSPLDRQSLGHDALAAAGFVINIAFTRRGDNYFAVQASQASPLLHFWSLALEEQFYVIWPLVLAVAAKLRRPRVLIGLLTAGLVIASFIAGWWYTRHSPITGFYMLPTRSWELGVGALLAAAGTGPARIPDAIRAVLGWLGLAGVLVAALVINDHTPFPGYAALFPVLSTAALLTAGSAPSRRSPAALLSLAPLQWVGQRSYAIYLWHWPVYILALANWGHLSDWQSATAMAVSVLLAAISYAVLENPIRHDTWLAARPRRPLVLGGALIGTTALLAVATVHQPIPTGIGLATAPTLALTVSGGSNPGTEATGGDLSPKESLQPGPPSSGAVLSDTQATDQPTSSTYSPAATRYPNIETLVERNLPNLTTSLAVKDLPANITPKLSSARWAQGKVFDDGCILRGKPTDIGTRSCLYGDLSSPTRVTVVGDSHAVHWFPALEALAIQHRWRLHVLIKTGCLPEDIDRFLGGAYRSDCIPWRRNLLSRLQAERPDLILVSHHRYDFGQKEFWARRGNEWEPGVADFLLTMKSLAPTVAFLGDIPRPLSNVPACLLRHPHTVDRCSLSRASTQPSNIRNSELRAATAAGTPYIDPTDWLCTDTRCVVILGNILVYSDNQHLTQPMALYLKPFLEAVLVPLVEPPG